MTDYSVARHNMVEGQIKPNKVVGRDLIEAMATVPRELFVPKAARGFAYVDEDIALGNGRYLVEPMVQARLIEAAGITPDDVVLDIGCGSGYSTALLARLANTVVAVESDADLARAATEVLASQGIDNAVVVEAPLSEGYPAQAPYRVILVNGSVTQVPERIASQLTDGGRLVTVIAPNGGVGRGVVIERIGGILSERTLFDAATPTLPGFEAPERFVF